MHEHDQKVLVVPDYSCYSVLSVTQASKAKGNNVSVLTGAHTNTEYMQQLANFFSFSSPAAFLCIFPFLSKTPTASSVFSLSSLAQTRSHLWWGEVLYFINSRMHAKIHYAGLLFSRNQACQLTCGTNFYPPPSLLTPPPSPPLLLISMFRI